MPLVPFRRSVQILAFVCSALAAQDGPLDLKSTGFVDMRRVLDWVARTQNLGRVEAQGRRTVQTEVDRSRRRIQALQTRLSNETVAAGKNPDLTDRERLASLEGEIRLLEEDLAVTVAQKVQATYAKERAASRNLLRVVGQHVERIARADKLVMIVDRGDWVRYVNPKLDYTEKLIRSLERDRDTLRLVEGP